MGDIVFSVLQVRAHDIIHNLLKWSILLILVQYVLHRIARLLKSCKPAPMSERFFSMTRSLVCIKSSQKSNLRVCTVKSPQQPDEIVANFKNLVRLLTFPYTKLFTQTLYQSLVLLKKFLIEISIVEISTDFVSQPIIEYQIFCFILFIVQSNLGQTCNLVRGI